MAASEKGIVRGRAREAALDGADAPIFLSLLRAAVLAAVVATLIMVGLPTVLALGSAAG